MGPMGWVLEWIASIALGTVLSAWVLGELYLGESHEELMPVCVIICVQRLTLASTGIDVAKYLDGSVEGEVRERAPLEEFSMPEGGVAQEGMEDGLWDDFDCEDFASDEEAEFVDAMLFAHAGEEEDEGAAPSMGYS
eukprot:TRINITY_DN2013_c0_g1_i7.p1 TRINITY_DN2013_c0_g1~~TRINITY_DN2013_c0_g1_i7.p1  ORF type:complete len:137 (-),score=50.89 TRINITY_DN2013_c0_g1_i7:184-594(-)